MKAGVRPSLSGPPGQEPPWPGGCWCHPHALSREGAGSRWASASSHCVDDGTWHEGGGGGREQTAEPALRTQGPGPVDGSHTAWSQVRPVPPLTRPHWLSPAGTGAQLTRSAQSSPSSCPSDKRAQGLDQEPGESRAAAGSAPRPGASGERTGLGGLCHPLKRYLLSPSCLHGGLT